MFLLAGLLFAFTVQAQTISVHGVVTDPTGEPLIGASILAAVSYTHLTLPTICSV